jgi:hypothetical protein
MMIACFGSDPMGWKWNGVCMGWMDGWLIDRLEELQCYDIIIRADSGSILLVLVLLLCVRVGLVPPLMMEFGVVTL